MSTKWGDFLITKIEKDKDIIVSVFYRLDNGDSVSSEDKRFTREELINLIDNNKRFVTIYRNTEGKWMKGEEVYKVEVEGKRFIRTDRNLIPQDSLGLLPE